MNFLSKIGLIHSLLNRQHNIIIRFLFANFSLIPSLLSTLDFSLSFYIYKEILYGNDLKTEFRRVLWFFKNKFLPFLTSTDLMFDFCMGLNLGQLNKIKKRLYTLSKLKQNIVIELNLLKVIAHEIEYARNSQNLTFKSNSNNEFLIQLKKVKQLLNNTTKIYLKKSRNNLENVSFLKVGMNIKDARDALIDIDSFFSSFRCSWFAMSGTFLGVVRERRFLKHDLDVDIGINADSAQFGTFIEKIKRSTKFEVSRIEYQREYLDNKRSILRPVFVRVVHANGINIDFYWHFESNGKIYHGTSYLLWENSIFDLTTYEVYGLKINGPSDWNLYLTETYGNWKKEKKDYNFHRDMNSLSGARNLLGIEYLLRSSLLCGKKNYENLKSLEKLIF